jgi:hypothetical protein
MRLLIDAHALLWAMRAVVDGFDPRRHRGRAVQFLRDRLHLVTVLLQRPLLA